MEAKLKFRVRLLLLLFMAGLILSGLTAIPLQQELDWVLAHGTWMPSALQTWLSKVLEAIAFVNTLYPFLNYGTDWLAFGHLVIAMVFIGAVHEPVRNIWVIRFGLLACAAVLPFALIFGTIRGIPGWWQMIDCSFGILGAIPLFLALRLTKKLEIINQPAVAASLQNREKLSLYPEAGAAPL
jgi:hypothetical protein